MKLCKWSDLHLEMAKTAPTWKNPGADVLILSGDICIANDLYRNPRDIDPNVIRKDDRIRNARLYRDFFNHVSDQFNHVIYVAGNHEHYRGRWDQTIDILIEETEHYPNIHFLEQNGIVIDNIVFLGASLWTDMNKIDPITMMNIRDIMNDYKVVADFSNGKWGRLFPTVTVAKHQETLQWLKIQLNEDNRKTVVVTHHAPSFKSINEIYKNEWLTNGAYVSDLSEFIIENPNIILWTCGHVHHSHRYYIGDTLCISNPLGYSNERTGFNPSKIVDLNSLPTFQEVDNDYNWTNF